MDIQRTILWVIFGLSLLFLWDNWQKSQGRPAMFSSPTAEKKAEPGAATSASTSAAPATAPAAKAAPADASVPQAPVKAAPAASALPSAEPAPAAGERVRVETDALRVEIDSAGAVLARAELRTQTVAPDWTANGLLALVTGKKQDANANVVLLDVNPNRTYLAQSGLIGAPEGATFPTHRTPWRVVPGPRTLAADAASLPVRFEAEAGGLRVAKTLIFFRGRHDVKVTHEVTNATDAPLTPSLYLQIMRDGNKPEGESALYYVFTGPAVYTEQAKFQKVEFKDIERGKTSFVKQSGDGWIAMIQHYFVSAWVPPKGVARENYTLNPSQNLYAMGTKYPLGTLAPGATVSSESSFYVGPQNQHELEKLAPGLELVVDYGWLTFISKPLFWLLEFLYGLVGNWGWAIVLLTIIVKGAFYPLSAASYRSMARMKEVTPRMMKIRDQYANDKQKMNLAMMELYKNEKINPLGGCLPILVQIPVFIALYWVLLASVETRNQPWMLWVKDLATPDPWFILPAVMIATMWIQYKLNPTPPDPVQAKVMAAMPFIFGVMFFFFPAGLVLYWLVNNLLSIAQQWYVTKQIAKEKPAG
jgi:YidC/Oxa1 family membrane protein insertase